MTPSAAVPSARNTKIAFDPIPAARSTRLRECTNESLLPTASAARSASASASDVADGAAEQPSKTANAVTTRSFGSQNSPVQL